MLQAEQHAALIARLCRLIKTARLTCDHRTKLMPAQCRLTSDTPASATGAAEWRLGQDNLAGTLKVRLGGKNMTFYQRVQARRVGSCEAAATGR